MKTQLHRVCLVVLTVTGIFVGGWAYVAPMHWYNTFPGMGLRWLPVFGPFNDHFVEDIGAMYLAMAALSGVAIFHVTNQALMRATALSLSIFNMLHLIYHLSMLHMYGPLDAALNTIALTIVVVCALALAIPVRARTAP